MRGVVPSPEVLRIKHQRDRGLKTLIAWFRAELNLRDEATKERICHLTDAHLEQHQNEVVNLANRWSNERKAAESKTDVA